MSENTYAEDSRLKRTYISNSIDLFSGNDCCSRPIFQNISTEVQLTTEENELEGG